MDTRLYYRPVAARDMMSYVTVVEFCMMSYVTVVERCHLLPASGYWEGKGKMLHVTK